MRDVENTKKKSKVRVEPLIIEVIMEQQTYPAVVVWL